MTKRREISNAEALSNRGISRCMDVLVDLLKTTPHQPRWLLDEQTMELSELQPDNTYRAAFKVVPITT